MPLRINNNIAAMNAKRRLNANNRDLNLRLERLSSGLRVNRAADDAAGLSVREGMRAEISGLKMNVLNAEQATNLLQVAEGSLNEINAMMIRMRELAVQSSSSTMTDQNRQSIQAEYSQVLQEIDRISLSTTYNDQVLLTGFGNNIDTASTTLTASSTSGVANLKISGASSGTYTFMDTAGDSTVTLGNGVVTQTSVVANFDRLGVQVTLAGHNAASATGSYVDGELDGQTIIINSGTGGSFQVGPDDGINNRIEATIPDMRASGPFINLNTTSVATINSSRSAITQIDQAITHTANVRGDQGALMNRLSFTVSFTENEIENIQSSESSISDADIADEVANMTRSQILSQAATAMLAQANAVPQTALQLLRQ